MEIFCDGENLGHAFVCWDGEAFTCEEEEGEHLCTFYDCDGDCSVKYGYVFDSGLEFYETCDQSHHYYWYGEDDGEDGEDGEDRE